MSLRRGVDEDVGAWASTQHLGEARSGAGDPKLDQLAVDVIIQIWVSRLWRSSPIVSRSMVMEWLASGCAASTA